MTPKCEVELLWGSLSNVFFFFFTWDLKLNKKKEPFSFLSVLIIKLESYSLLGSLVAARLLSAGEARATER